MPVIRSLGAISMETSIPLSGAEINNEQYNHTRSALARIQPLARCTIPYCYLRFVVFPAGALFRHSSRGHWHWHTTNLCPAVRHFKECAPLSCEPSLLVHHRGRPRLLIRTDTITKRPQSVTPESGYSCSAKMAGGPWEGRPD